MGSVVLPHLGKLYFHTNLLRSTVGVNLGPVTGVYIRLGSLLLTPSAPTQLPGKYLTNSMTVTGWHVDQAIMSEDERLVIIRFGRDWDPDCMRQDEVLYRQSPAFALLCFY